MSLIPLPRQKQIIQRVQQDRARRREFLQQMSHRQQQGWQIARQAAQQLKTQFGVHRVVLFGSLLAPEQMTWHSDIDLAVWGLPKNQLYRAGATIERGHDFSIDIVEAESAKPHIRDGISGGVEL